MSAHLPEISKDAIALMAKMNEATDGRVIRALRVKIENTLNAMTSKTQAATLREARRLGLWE